MNTTDGIWVPSYYRRRRPFAWARAAGGPKVADWVAGVVFAAVVLGLVAFARAPQRQAQGAPSVAVAAPTAEKDNDTNADRVAYVPQPSKVNK